MKDSLRIFSQLLSTPGGSPKGTGLFCVPSLVGSADAFLALSTASDPRSTVLAITPGIPESDRLFDDLVLLSAKTNHRILGFPAKLEADNASLAARHKVVSALREQAANPSPLIIVAPFLALTSPVPAVLHHPIQLSLSPADNTDTLHSVRRFDDLREALEKSGYTRAPQVEKEGDYSIRGGIVDAWSFGEEFPVRAEFFGEDLESLRTFNAATQLSIERIDHAELMPISDEGEGRTCPLFDLLPENTTLIAFEHNSYHLAALPLNRPSPAAALSVIFTGLPAPAGVPVRELTTTPLPGFAELSGTEAHHPELFEAARKRLDQHLAAARKRGTRILRFDDLSCGFELSSASLIVVTKADRVFTKRKASARRTARQTESGPRLSDFDELEVGEYVVHVDHGVGRFIGSSEIATDHGRSEVFTIEYADGAKLHVPATHAHLLSRYIGVKGEAVKLHRLDGTAWEKDKKDAQKAVADLAAALLETQARRAIVPGFAYNVACEGLEAFEAAFPYRETPDQLAAIAAVKRDLAAAKPMDRLICGDAGYGKTEVAMRAAYIAAMNLKQVVVLAPTTVLAEQHFETFTARFDGTPVRIESMSRFQTRATHEGTFKRIESGACDIVIATHAILTSQVAFRDLGLIIIDEEQRFGVRHKEFLKRLRETADVLTLSATPIPRTLYLSMTGARDLSLLRSPPEERVAVETRITTDSDAVIRAAITAELARGGQVFFLHNRVLTIGKVEKRLKEIVPSARIVVAHGQMDSVTLAKKMRLFERGDYDILLSTTIIESGIDIPRANTILVDHAETFGLADLYQLRGRVGRSTLEGRAIFLLPMGGTVDSDARERLKALKRHGSLGAGFDLAVRDLELRGAGNLLGSQQSGHIASVGFHLYCQLLKRTIALLKGEKVRDVIDVKLNLDFTDLSIPYTYIEEDALRMSILSRFAAAQDPKDLRELARELADRFGPPPESVKAFLAAAKLRLLCAERRIGAIDVKAARAILYGLNRRDIVKVVALKGRTERAKLEEITKAL